MCAAAEMLCLTDIHRWSRSSFFGTPKLGARAVVTLGGLCPSVSLFFAISVATPSGLGRDAYQL